MPNSLTLNSLHLIAQNLYMCFIYNKPHLFSPIEHVYFIYFPLTCMPHVSARTEFMFRHVNTRTYAGRYNRCRHKTIHVQEETIFSRCGLFNSTHTHRNACHKDVFCMILIKMAIISVSSVIRLIYVMEMECFLRSRNLTLEYSDQIYTQIFKTRCHLPTCTKHMTLTVTLF
jgi:hypothetical protein